jgi:uncharacterized protein YecE (DUF72 family)
MDFDRDQLKAALAALAASGAFVGTSSWKYPGWLGQLYTRDRYVWRGRYAASRFERNCLAEYAEVFQTVCVDAAYYQFPQRDSLVAMAEQVPMDFRFAFKVTDEITMRRFPVLPRFGIRAGQLNGNFLNAGLFTSAFLGPCEAIRPHVGLLMFEFTQFHSADFARGREFVAALDEFLAQLPRGWPYAVEIRNRSFLQPEYFATLARHGMAHVFNSWTDMPAIGEQLEIPGVFPNRDLFAARFLLKPGRKYEEAVKRFSPYERIQEANPEGRTAGVKLMKHIQSAGKRIQGYIFVNNRFEGSALQTIAAMVNEVGSSGWASADRGQR